MAIPRKDEGLRLRSNQLEALAVPSRESGIVVIDKNVLAANWWLEMPLDGRLGELGHAGDTCKNLKTRAKGQVYSMYSVLLTPCLVNA